MALMIMAMMILSLLVDDFYATFMMAMMISMTAVMVKEMIMTLTEAGARFLQHICDDNDDLVSGDVGERYVPMTMM